jgi:hypothetical protein
MKEGNNFDIQLDQILKENLDTTEFIWTDK